MKGASDKQKKDGAGAGGEVLPTLPLAVDDACVLDSGIAVARKLAQAVPPGNRLSFARGVTSSALAAYWAEHQKSERDPWPMAPTPTGLAVPAMPHSAAALAHHIGVTAARLDVLEASYQIGLLYTAMMPEQARSEAGAYYTPPALCERLMDLAAEAGVDWRTARVLDPACGGGAFLAPVARRMAEALRDCSAPIALKNIGNRLRGFEIDPFAAWMSHVFLEVALMPLCRAAGSRLPNVVDVCDSLEQEPAGEGYTLVIGNPPYGRVTLPPALRNKYRRSLYGHANLYGVFTDLALRLTRPGGIIAFVTPTSFLSGEYYKALRSLLALHAPPAAINFVADRKGIFADVQQETLLAVYRRGGEPRVGQVHFLSSTRGGDIQATAAGSFQLPTPADRPWLMPRAKADRALVHAAEGMPYRLADYGYKVSTGPLVWNRHKASLRDRHGKHRYPLIWAESVRADGVFAFSSEKRNHRPFFEPTAAEEWVVTDYPCVLLQRTTAKEQGRRLIAAELPKEFLEKYDKVAIENHLNMVRPKCGQVAVSTAAVAALLNTRIVDRLFRCINGSVAVSAYELESIPLPSPEAMKRIDRLVSSGAGRDEIERAVEALYTVETV